MFNISIRRTELGDVMITTATARYLMKAEGGCFGFAKWQNL